MATPYELALQTDPIWDAFLAQYGYRSQAEKAAADLKRKQTDMDYTDGLTELAQRGVSSNQDLTNNLLARGVFSSGEASTRRDELANTLGQARTAADTAYTRNKAKVDADLQSALDSLDFEREREVAASRERLAAKEREAAAATMANAGTSAEGFAAAASAGTTSAPTASFAPTAATNTRPSNESGLGYSSAGTGQRDDLIDAITMPNATTNRNAQRPQASSNDSGRGYSSAPRRAAPTTPRPPRQSPLAPYQRPR